MVAAYCCQNPAHLSYPPMSPATMRRMGPGVEDEREHPLVHEPALKLIEQLGPGIPVQFDDRLVEQRIELREVASAVVATTG
jgi:hypothetical protein